LQVIEEGEWEDIKFRPAKRVPAPEVTVGAKL
jgi:hypothetical protein